MEATIPEVIEIVDVDTHIDWHALAKDVKIEEANIRPVFAKDNEYANQCVNEFLDDNTNMYFWSLKEEQQLGFTVNRLARRTVYQKYGMEA